MNSLGYPYLGFGLGLRSPHYDYVLQNRPPIDWFEIITENYIDNHKGYWDYLTDLRNTYPLVMHGVSLSIGSTDELNLSYLQKVKKLAQHINAPWVSDHLCYTGIGGHNTHDLLPVPYTQEMLSHVVARLKETQDILERRIVIENPSSYIEFASSQMPEWEFMVEMAEQADCGILLDVNNIYVTSRNHGLDAKKYIDAIPANRIVQVHLAGHTDKGDVVIDTHSTPVIDDVWKLYKHLLTRTGKVSTMVEWDENVPDFKTLQAELEKARGLL